MTGVTREVAARRAGQSPMPAPPYKAVDVIGQAEVSVEVLATAIVTISDGMKKLRSGRLADRALLILIRDACGPSISLSDIRAVLDAIGDLRKKYVKP